MPPEEWKRAQAALTGAPAPAAAAAAAAAAASPATATAASTAAAAKPVAVLQAVPLAVTPIATSAAQVSIPPPPPGGSAHTLELRGCTAGQSSCNDFCCGVSRPRCSPPRTSFEPSQPPPPPTHIILLPAFRSVDTSYPWVDVSYPCLCHPQAAMAWPAHANSCRHDYVDGLGCFAGFLLQLPFADCACNF